MLSGFVYKLFGALNFNKYFDKENSSISLIKDRFSDFLDYTLRSHAYEPHVAGHASKKKSRHMHAQHDHMHMHAQQITYAPSGCMKFTHTHASEA